MPSLGGLEWIILLMVLAIPVGAAMFGYRIGRKQGRAQVQGWSQGQPLR